MMEMFSDWMPVSATLSGKVTTNNAAGQPITSVKNIDGTHKMAKWVTASVKTNNNDKFALYETGKLAIDYKKFYITTVVVDPPSSTTVEVFPDATWYATIDGKKYFIDGVDNIGSMNEVYEFTYHKERQ